MASVTPSLLKKELTPVRDGEGVQWVEACGVVPTGCIGLRGPVGPMS